MLKLAVLVLVTTSLISGGAALYWMRRARRLQAELKALMQKLSTPMAQETALPQLSDFELRRLEAHRQAEEQAQALLDWESEGGLVKDNQEEVDPDDHHVDHLWHDIGGEG